MFEIIKNAPRLAANGIRYPFAAMEVGDSFDAPRDMGKQGNSKDRRQNTITACARGWAKRHNPAAKFAVRIMDENTVRCQRIA